MSNGLPPGFIPLPPRDSSAPAPAASPEPPMVKAEAPKPEPARSALTAMMHGRGAAERGSEVLPGVKPDPRSAPAWTVPAAEIALTAPLIAYGGGALGNMAAKLAPFLGKAAPAVGRVAAVGVKSAADAKMEGRDILSLPVLLDIALAGTTEAALGGAGRLIKRFGKPARGFEVGNVLPAKALEIIRRRVPAGRWINAPTLSPNRPITVEEAVKILPTKHGPAYIVGLKELKSELNRLDIQRVTGPKPLAGDVFKDYVSKKHFPPSSFAKGAEGTRRALMKPGTRAGVEAAVTEDIPGSKGIPAGAIIASSPSWLWNAILRRITP